MSFYYQSKYKHEAFILYRKINNFSHRAFTIKIFEAKHFWERRTNQEFIELYIDTSIRGVITAQRIRWIYKPGRTPGRHETRNMRYAVNVACRLTPHIGAVKVA